MQRHLQRHHPEVPIAQRDASESGEEGNPSEHGQDNSHEQITSDFVHDVVLLDLVTFRASEKKGFKRFARKWCRKKVGGKKMVRKHVTKWYGIGKQAVKNKIQKIVIFTSRMEL